VLVSVCTDLTERKLAEKRLHKNELKFRSLFTSMHEGFALHELVYDNAGKPCDYVILDANPAFETITGIAPVEATGRLATDLYGTASAPFLERYATVALAGEPIQFETDFSPMNKTFFISAYSPVYGQFATIFQDISVAKKSEEAARKLDKLESLGVVAAGIAHDFNNLLNGIFGYMDLAKVTAADERAVANIDKAFAVFDRAKDLAQQLITFSNGGDPVTSTIDVAALLHDSLLFALSGSRVSCIWNLADGLWSCNADKNQIGQVFDNITINAREAMVAGGTLTIAARNIDITGNPGAGCKPGRYVRITFRDSGPGIAAENLHRVFDPFFTTKKEGTGLGLATAFSIIKKHGGSFDVVSEAGRGAEFIVLLPASEGTAEGQTHSNSAVDSLPSGTRVLVVDDEEFMRDLAAEMLDMADCAVSTAESGEVAIDLFATAFNCGQPFHAVLLDLTMPSGMDGKETAAKLLAINSNACIIATSGYSDDPVMSRPRDAGFTSALVKPYRKNELFKAIATVTR
jgi:signal transduction histidine kinase/CheY-like chemotaxis protein